MHSRMNSKTIKSAFLNNYVINYVINAVINDVIIALGDHWQPPSAEPLNISNQWP